VSETVNAEPLPLDRWLTDPDRVARRTLRLVEEQRGISDLMPEPVYPPRPPLSRRAMLRNRLAGAIMAGRERAAVKLAPWLAEDRDRDWLN